MDNNRPHLSNTSISMYLRCPRQYYWRYEEHRKTPPAGAMIQGRVGHLAVEHNYRQKIDTTKDLPVDEVTDYFAETFDDEIKKEEPIYDEGQTAPTLKDEGVLLVKEHRLKLAPTIMPATVEEKVNLDFGKDDVAFSLMAIFDLVDQDRNIRDNKFISRTPTADDLAKDTQLSTYSLAYRMQQRRDHGDQAQPETGLKIDAVVKNKTPKALTLTTGRTREALRLHLNTIGQVAKGIKAEVFPMNVGTFWCSKKMCGYWDICCGKGIPMTLDMGENLTKQLEDSIAKVEA